MKKNIEIAEKDYNDIIHQFYEYFENGYVFEEFLKIYLEKIGLDEVVVTQRSRDGGIDLTAIRPGVGDFGGQDVVKYFIQAKRNKPGTSINIDKVRALRGVLSPGTMGIFITTAKFSGPTISEFEAYQDRPIILIDGKSLVDSCISNEIGFIFKPSFNKTLMEELKKTEASINKKTQVTKETVEKRITANDIRARILSIPKMILDKIPVSQKEIEVTFNKTMSAKLTICRGRNYLAGVTSVYRALGLIDAEGVIHPTKAAWMIDDLKIYIDTQRI